jgi:hypothetical protein
MYASDSEIASYPAVEDRFCKSVSQGAYSCVLGTKIGMCWERCIQNGAFGNGVFGVWVLAGLCPYKLLVNLPSQ